MRRLMMLERKHEQPVKIFDIYRMPDGSEVQKQFIGFEGDIEKRAWEEETGAKHIDVLICVDDRAVALIDKGRGWRH